MAYQLFTKAALKLDLPAYKPQRGNDAAIVEAHPGRPGQGLGYKYL
ncbi:MAG: hypothetical protein HYU36_05330 [Planctomycetes bacterium]|nr:hypothetical protein [Planctomycetota bacterium]